MQRQRTAIVEDRRNRSERWIWLAARVAGGIPPSLSDNRFDQWVGAEASQSFWGQAAGGRGRRRGWSYSRRASVATDMSLLDAGDSLAQADFVAAIGLRAAIRSFVEVEPDARNASPAALELNAIAARFPLLVRVPARPSPWLTPQPGSSRLGLLLVQLCDLARSGELDRLKMCASDDCKWIFFDRSKPGNRRWCSTSLCGNRHKIRSYRERQRASRAI